MASIKLKFRPSTVADKEGVIYYQIIHERKVRQLLTDYHIFPAEWNEKRAMVMSNGEGNRYTFLLSLREHIRRDIERLNRIVKEMEGRGLAFSADDVIEEFRRYSHEYSLFNFMESLIIKLKQKGKIRTSETYAATLNSFRKFRREAMLQCGLHKDGDIMLDGMTADLMEEYDAYLLNRDITANTISFYMRILRAVYNRAVEDGIIEQRFPFRHVYTGIDKTIKRAIPLKMIKRIKGLDLSLNRNLDYARDIFLFSFYTRGMSFVDIAYLGKDDLVNGVLTYRRRKTGQQLFIKWEKCMQEIVDKYETVSGSPYLLPILKSTGENRSQYKNALIKINKYLKVIANMVGIKIPLTLYVARHSWASIAKSKNIPISVISEGMGHDSELTTQIYLASLDNSVVNRANSMILRDL